MRFWILCNMVLKRRWKNLEKNKMITDYESSVKTSKKINAKINKLSECITALDQKIKVILSISPNSTQFSKTLFYV